MTRRFGAIRDIGLYSDNMHEYNTATAMSPPVTLSAQNLVRHRDHRVVVDNVSLELRRGEVLGLLGHNGAGKSTTLQMLTGALPPHSGKIQVCGFDLLDQPLQAKACIGFLPEHPPLYRDMRVDDFLLFAARLHRIPSSKLAASLELSKQRCGLQDYGRKLIGALSKGYQQRVGIAQAIIHNPAVVVLDEPTVGLDPAQIRDIRALIRELGNSSSVILSTHLLNEVESICDRVIILQKGRLIYSGSSAEMLTNGNMEEAFMLITKNGAAAT
ncbi:putative ABC transporter ATP-binding protein YxlF [mine drainage metagenome]|uniref:Putative ABC transporter ATP-binding protein YxlF n=1 Tax=mine drainage metagenome TaxID=410659 RepID=A0A1J5SKR9_9ZZZZ